MTYGLESPPASVTGLWQPPHEHSGPYPNAAQDQPNCAAMAANWLRQVVSQNLGQFKETVWNDLACNEQACLGQLMM